MTFTVAEALFTAAASLFLGVLVGYSASRHEIRVPTIPELSLSEAFDKLVSFVDQELKNLQYQVRDQELSRRLFGLRESIQLAHAKAKGELPE